MNSIAPLDIMSIVVMFIGVLAVLAAVVGQFDGLNTRANGSLLLAALGLALIVGGAVMLT